MNDNWEQMAMGQAEIISGLSILCSDLIRELAMYRETDREEGVQGHHRRGIHRLTRWKALNLLIAFASGGIGAIVVGIFQRGILLQRLPAGRRGGPAGAAISQDFTEVV